MNYRLGETSFASHVRGELSWHVEVTLSISFMKVKGAFRATLKMHTSTQTQLHDEAR